MKDLLFEDLLDDLEKREESAARKVVDDIEPEKPTVRMALSYQMYKGEFLRLHKDDSDLFLNIYHRLKYIIENNSDYIDSYSLSIQFNVRNEFVGNVTSVNYNYDDPDDKLYNDTIGDVIREAQSEDDHLIISLRHFVDFVPKEVSFRRFSRQINYLVRAIAPKLPMSHLKEAMMAIVRLDKDNLLTMFMTKRNTPVTQSTMSDLYRKIFEDKKDEGLTMDKKYDDRYTSRYYSFKHTHMQNFLVYLRSHPKIFNGFVVWPRGEKLWSHKDEYYQVYLKITGDPNINLPEEVRVRTTDEIIDLVRDHILPQFNRKDQMAIDKTAPWREYSVLFNICVPVSVVLNPHSNTFRYETEITSPNSKKIKLEIRLYCDTKKWAMQETLVDPDGTISETGEGLTYMKIGAISNEFKNNCF